MMPIRSRVPVAATAAVVSISVYHARFVAPRLRSIATTAAGGASEEASLSAARATRVIFAKATNERLRLLDTSVACDLLRIGFVRYNSFRDGGSYQSFTLAIVNRDGDGVVVNSLFGRDETRTCGKATRRAFVPVHNASNASKGQEAAIRRNRSGNGVFVRA